MPLGILRSALGAIGSFLVVVASLFALGALLVLAERRNWEQHRRSEADRAGIRARQAEIDRRLAAVEHAVAHLLADYEAD
jgi:uncharacterized membrane protein YdfJ with MMPL/SSD domain